MSDLLFDEAPGGAGAYGLSDDEAYYRFPPPPGIDKPKGWRGWTRATNLVGAFSDQRALQLWLERMTLLGLLENEGLIFDELAAIPEDDLSESVLEFMAEKARNAVGSDAGARRGTARHNMLETYLTTGARTGHRRMRLQMDSLMEAMEANKLDFIPGHSERRIWHPAGKGTMGTYDARVLCRRTGQEGILDLKTQARFWTYQEICGQQYLYDSAPWVWEGPEDESGRWVKAENNNLRGHEDGPLAGKRVALLAHMPQSTDPAVQLPVQIHEVDVEYGQEVVYMAAAIRELRSIGKSVAAGRRVGAVRPPSVVPGV